LPTSLSCFQSLLILPIMVLGRTKEAHKDSNVSEVSSSFSFQSDRSVSSTSFRSLLLQIDPDCEAK
jgi:hypothetical protein